jgi:hypothetical protein
VFFFSFCFALLCFAALGSAVNWGYAVGEFLFTLYAPDCVREWLVFGCSGVSALSIVRRDACGCGLGWAAGGLGMLALREPTRLSAAATRRVSRGLGGFFFCVFLVSAGRTLRVLCHRSVGSAGGCCLHCMYPCLRDAAPCMLRFDSIICVLAAPAASL